MRELLIRNRAMIFMVIAGLLIIAVVLAVALCMVLHKKKDSLSEEIREQKLKKRTKIVEARKVVSPDGINPNPMSYTVIHDAGHDIYVRSFTIDTLPKEPCLHLRFRHCLILTG